MGAWHIWRRRGDEADGARLRAIAHEQLQLHGLSVLNAIATEHYEGFHAEPVQGGPACFHTDGADFAAVAGTLIYDRKMGEAGLAALLADFRFPFTAWDKVSGHFALLIYKGGVLHALTDWFGAFQLFHDSSCDILSTSLLASAKSLSRLTIDAQGIYEFAFSSFCLGDRTPFEQLRRLGPDAQLELGRAVRRVEVDKPLPQQTADVELEERLDQHADILRDLVKPYATQFGDAIDCPLSAGFDSRLVFGLLRNVGVAPHAYIYGSSDHHDVVISTAIAAAEGFHLEAFEKARFREPDQETFAAQVASNFNQIDGLTTDGALFDNGGNSAARMRRQRGGRATASGGCGEIFRNFFFLPDRRVSPMDVARAFYCAFDPRELTERFDAERYFTSIAAEAAKVLGAPGDERTAMPRTLIEQLYPRLRCRAFFGREISIVARHGPYLMPFYEPAIVEQALRLPLSLKNNGRFEAALITRLDPALAKHTSSYGYAFDQPPNLSHRLSEFSTRIRPVFLRSNGYRIRRTFGLARGDDHGGLLAKEWLMRVIELDMPYMRHYFRPDQIRDNALYRQVASLEYLCQQLGSRVVI